MTRPIKAIIKWAIAGRLSALIVQVTLNLVVKDYDSSSCCSGNDSTLEEFIDPVEVVFGGLSRWDSVFFLHIATSGYSYEHFAAFFPVWPVTLRISVLLLKALGLGLSIKVLLLLSTFVWTFIFMGIAAVALFYLGKTVLRQERLAACAAFLFCLNPATVFITAAYSGALFAAIGFSSMLAWAHGRTWLAAILNGVAGGTRSNGTLLVGFLLYDGALEWLEIIRERAGIAPLIKSTVKQFIVLFVKCCISLLPFIGYQYYIYHSFCSKNSFSFNEHNRQLSAQIHSPPWCNASIPLSYSSIQSKYWNVGFLRYYEVKQVPNFILATPVIVAIISCAWSFFRVNPGTVWTLGLLPRGRTHTGLWSERVFVYLAHVSFLVIVGVTTIHVQVLTRLVATSSPILYWYFAHLLLSSNNAQPSGCAGRQCFGVPRMVYLVMAYFVGFAYLGLALHTNFYPWT